MSSHSDPWDTSYRAEPIGDGAPYERSDGQGLRTPATNEPSHAPGPFRADQIRDGDPYELSNGHAIRCMTANKRHGASQSAGVLVLRSDPAVTQEVGIDVGIAFNDGKNLRSPDLIVGTDRNPGWETQPPPLAVEYADSGQNEHELRTKIAELLAFGTRIIWVVRLTGPLRVEIHEPGRTVRVAGADDVLHADGILQNPVPVRALVDPDIALEAALHNILARKGYRSLDHIREEAHQEGRKEGHKEGRKEGHKEGHKDARQESLAELRALVLTQLEARGWTLSPALQARLDACGEAPTLVRWYAAVLTAPDVETALR